MPEEGLPPILTLTIEARHPLRADLTAAAIDRLAVHFYQWQNQRVGPVSAKLRIASLYSGSIVAKLIAVADAAQKVHENVDLAVALRDLVAGYYQQLLDAFQILCENRPGKARQADRKTLQKLAAPVAMDNAASVSLQLIGENMTVIIVTPDNARRILGEQKWLTEALPLVTSTVEDMRTELSPAEAFVNAHYRTIARLIQEASYELSQRFKSGRAIHFLLRRDRLATAAIQLKSFDALAATTANRAAEVMEDLAVASESGAAAFRKASARHRERLRDLFHWFLTRPQWREEDGSTTNRKLSQT